ncbi:MAG: alpha/beta hydrolase [Peptostreptococcus sp.]|uniref:alpha/beta hydrolase n=1 Tax=Peptostreptococcus sp. TaxID=1262 RepID=UPI002FC8C0E8
MALKVILLIVVIVAIFVIAMSIYVGNKMTKPERAPLLTNPKDALALDYEDIEFTSEGNKIEGWYIASEEDRFTVVYSHGYLENRESPTMNLYNIMLDIHDFGGNLLTFDFSGSGVSEGKCVTCGYRESKDLKKAIEFAKTKSDAPIFIYGISMGAATTALVAGESQDIAGAICDSPFSNLKDYLSINLGVWTNLPKYPFQPIIFKTMEKVSGLSLDSVNPSESVKKAKVPILIMHGRGDHLIPYTESVKLHDLNPEMVTLDIMENDGHCSSLNKQRERYLANFKKFIEENI